MRSFWYESPVTCREIPISYSEVEDLAAERGDDRKAEDMDDDTFYFYCDIIAERVFEDRGL